VSWERSQRFGSSLNQVGTARRFAISVVQEWGCDFIDLGLVVGELAANAVVHGRSGFTVSLSCRWDRIVVEVADDNPGLPSMVVAPGAASSGRGLVIVDRLSKTWGVRPEPSGGKVIWADLEYRAAVAPLHVVARPLGAKPP